MTFYFYDLETSGFSPRTGRIMQFAGQRTDMDFNSVNEPDNLLIKLTPDVLPDPDAVLTHGITPQLTLKDGLTEAEFIKYLTSKVFKPDTIIVGYNNIRFDDEFMSFTFWRNFHDAYEWQWKDGCGRWDLLDVVRMTRAIRPAGVEWPVDSDGKASNRLALMSKINQLDHRAVHDALSDVQAVIALAKLLKTAQPQLFDYLLNLRDKNKVKALVEKGDPLVYTSGRYSSEFEKTTVAVMVAPHPDRGAALMYDLRTDPVELMDLTPPELAARWHAPWNARSSEPAEAIPLGQDRDEDAPQFPVKLLSYNKCPAIAPVDILDKLARERIKIDLDLAKANLQKMRGTKDLADKLVAALKIMQPKTQPALMVDPQKVDEQLYDGFVSNGYRAKMPQIKEADDKNLSDLRVDFEDERLQVLVPLYKARNYPQILNPAEQKQWQQFRAARLLAGGNNSRAARFFRRLSEASNRPSLTDEERYLLEELNRYAQSIVPQASGALAGIGSKDSAP